jgi:hypothetical protein
MPGCVFASGTLISRTSFPAASLTRSFMPGVAFFTRYWIIASLGGFSPMKYAWPQNSSLRSSFVFHSSALPGVKSFTSALAVCAAVYS